MKLYVGKCIESYLQHYRGLPKAAWQGVGLNLFESTFLGIYYFLPLYFIKTLHYSITSSGIIISFFGIGTILGGYYGGKLTDKLSPKFVCISSLSCQAFIFLLLVTIENFTALCLVISAMGFYSYAFITAIQVWVLDQCQHDSNLQLKAVNLLNVGSNIGLASSAIIIGIYNNYNFQFIFVLCAICLFILSIYSAKIKAPSKSIFEKSSNRVYNQPYTNLQIRIMLLCTLLMGFIIFQTNTTYALYLQQIFPQYGMHSLSILFTMNCLMVIFMQTQLVASFRRFNSMYVMGLGSLLIGSGMMLLAYPINFFIAIISNLIYTVGEMLFCATSQLISYECASANKKGGSVGLYRTVYATSRLSAPTLGTQIYYWFNPNTLWYLCGVLGILCFTLSTWRWQEAGYAKSL